jgi:hypothetical protein
MQLLMMYRENGFRVVLALDEKSVSSLALSDPRQTSLDPYLGRVSGFLADKRQIIKTHKLTQR